MLIKQAQTKPQETVEIKRTECRETVSFNQPINIVDGLDWMIGVITLEVYNYIFNITDGNNKFKVYTDTFDEFSFTELKNELEEPLNISNILSEHLQDETIGPRKISAYRNSKMETEKRQTDGFYMLLMGYARSPFRDFEIYLRMFFGLDGDDIELNSKQYKSNCFANEITPGICSIENNSEGIYTMGDYEGTLQLVYDDITMKTKLN